MHVLYPLQFGLKQQQTCFHIKCPFSNQDLCLFLVPCQDLKTGLILQSKIRAAHIQQLCHLWTTSMPPWVMCRCMVLHSSSRMLQLIQVMSKCLSSKILKTHGQT